MGVAGAFAAAAMLAYVLFSGGYLITVLGFATIYAIFVTGLNFFMGYTGQVSFGQNAFAAVSGYTSAVLTTAYGWQPLAALPVGVLGAAALAFLIGYPTLRLRGHYLAMATLALGLIVYEIAVEWQSVTQGYMGISGIPALGIGKWELASDRQSLVALLAILALALWVAARLKASRLGGALTAIAGSEDAARALGIDVARYKLTAFVVAAVYAAIAGSLFVHFVGFVSPEVYGLHMVVLGFTMLYVGGIGTVYGPVVGALIVSLLPETFRGFKEYQDLAYGAALILLLIYAPKGLASLARFLPGRASKESTG
jgi:branched-chain amino acid transport system permease protein